MYDAAALSALEWWRLAGVDMIVDEAPRNWLRPTPSVPAGSSSAPAAAPSAVPAPAAAPESLPATLDTFRQWLAGAPGLPGDASSRILPVGNPASGLMLLGDMPESDDVRAGQLFSGDLGRLFDRMLAAIGRDRASIYLAALAPGRPAGGRIDPAMLDRLTRIARHHVALAAPRRLLLLGPRPVRALLGLEMAEARGRLHEITLNGVATTAVATFDPQMLYRQPALKAGAWADLRLLLGTAR
ncbi:uracil-DNA glycosylase [Sphingomonas oleivorans]|uniref:Uracil-DNA glycosylase n=1 Tax=Sphingomonas oleivorans TaxID=1735121 RepID=A0A2T5FWQ3_9SPHN|nr:uracil-DNA glycosylase family protein [Sphingomonas oleivorans]PTQ10220.1 uracil-DNA glycosylase [Sphingomonas oleivorans]